ncbi:MAG TPA: hypothetical protein VMU90_10040, partial [Solirubrobacteraceae bacterium]|nr:hypothetical protein [Solirubrobacteraceae bacterium]
GGLNPAGVPVPPVPPAPPAPEGATHQIVGRAEAEAARLLAHAHERVDELKAQIEQLLGVRERLLRSARDLVHQYEEEVTQLELRYPATTADQMAAASEGGARSASGATAQPMPLAAPVPLPAYAQPAPPLPPAYAELAPPPAPAPPAPEPAARPALFEGVVIVIVPWISRLQTIQVLEDSLTRVRGAQLAYVRGYNQGEVRLELVLGEAVDLIGELNRALPYAFAVESARQDEIVIRLERGETGGGSVG